MEEFKTVLIIFMVFEDDLVSGGFRLVGPLDWWVVHWWWCWGGFNLGISQPLGKGL